MNGLMEIELLKINTKSSIHQLFLYFCNERFHLWLQNIHYNRYAK